MTELEKTFERQALWQRSRAALSWEEKLRLALVLRSAALLLRPHQANAPQDDQVENSGPKF